MNLLNKLKKPLKSLAIGIGLSLATIPAYTQNRSINFEKENFEAFREKLYSVVREIHISRFPYNKFLYPDYKDVIEEEEEN